MPYEPVSGVGVKLAKADALYFERENENISHNCIQK